MIMAIIKYLSVIAFIGSIIWFIAAPDYEPGIAIVTSLSVVFFVWYVANRKFH